MLPVYFMLEAEQEVADAEDWYEAQRDGLGLEFRAALEEAVLRVQRSPYAASPVLLVPEALGVRQLLLKRFPYRIIFVPSPDGLWVLACAHQHRHPTYWRARGEGIGG